MGKAQSVCISCGAEVGESALDEGHVEQGLYSSLGDLEPEFICFTCVERMVSHCVTLYDFYNPSELHSELHSELRSRVLH